MAWTVDFCVNAIADGDVEAFDLLLQKLVQQITASQRSKAILRFRWVTDIPMFCTLFNNPGFIVKCGEFRRQLKDIYQFYISPCLGRRFTVTDLANALRFEECSHELQKLYVKDETDRSDASDFNIFAAILNTGKLYSILADYGVITKTLTRLCENGRDIRATDPSGKSVLHEAVMHMSPYDILEAIVFQGGDVDSTDKYGTTAFSSFVSKAKYFKDRQLEVVKILKLFLYQNPCISLNLGVIPRAKEYDLTNVPDISKGEETNENEAKRAKGKHLRPHEELRLLPWLHRYGFPISPMDDVDLPSLGLDHPRQLKDYARIKIRMTYPGRMLHMIIKTLEIPNSVKEYILMEDFSDERL